MKMLTKINWGCVARFILTTMVVVLTVAAPIWIDAKHRSAEQQRAANAQRERAALEETILDLKEQNDGFRTQLNQLNETINTLQQTKSELEQELQKAKDNMQKAKDDMQKTQNLPKGKLMALSGNADQTAIQSGNAEDWMKFTATAYSAFCPEGCTGKTATGFDIRDQSVDHRIIAVDPRVIPQYSIVEIEGQGYYKALDTGGAIKGRKIDVLVQSEREADKYGVHQVNLRIIRRGNGGAA